MAHQRPTDLPDTEPARQTDDPGLSNAGTSSATNRAAGPDSRPGVLIAIGFLVVFAVVLVVAIVAGLVG